MNKSITPHHIQSVSVKNLFGRYTYTLPDKGKSLSNLNILYGNNGAGKTTLLSLIFHMLSPSQQGSHRSKISEIPFEQLDIILNDGTHISAKKDAQLLVGPVKFSISNNTKEKVEYDFNPSADRNSFRFEDLPLNIDLKKIPANIRPEIARSIAGREYHSALNNISVVSYMLTSDRILMSDSLTSTDLERQPESRRRLSEMVSERRTELISKALQTASRWVQEKYFERSYRGESTKNLYEDIVIRIANTTNKTKTGLNKAQEISTISKLEEQISDLNKRTLQLAKFGLGNPSISPNITQIIKDTKGNRLHLISSILEPYLSSAQSRIDEIFPLYTLIDTFVNSINSFLRDKKIRYSLRSGFQVVIEEQRSNTNSNQKTAEELTPSQLSSGEQQLLLLFCYVLVSRDRAGIFIIDEPEISLNILWQRSLINSLQELSKDAETQFIFASHSIEILSKHKDKVITIEKTKL